MKIVIPGGTGQVGAVLKRALDAAGHEVVTLTRRPRREGEVNGTVRPWGHGRRRWTAAISSSIWPDTL